MLPAVANYGGERGVRRGGDASSLWLIMEEVISQGHVAPPCQSVPSLGTRLIVIIRAHPLDCRLQESCDVGFPPKTDMERDVMAVRNRG